MNLSKISRTVAFWMALVYGPLGVLYVSPSASVAILLAVILLKFSGASIGLVCAFSWTVSAITAIGLATKNNQDVDSTIAALREINNQ